MPHLHAQVAGEILEEMCGQMGITDPQEVQEFALFLIKGEGEPRLFPAHQEAASVLGQQGRLWAVLAWALHAGEVVRPLWPHEYLNSVVVDQDMSLHSWRLSWETPLHFDHPIYTGTHYGQVSPPLPGCHAT